MNMIDMPVRLEKYQADTLRAMAEKFKITPEALMENILANHVRRRESPEVRRVKQLVGKAEPRFPPARLKSLRTLMVRIAMFRRTEDLLLLRQQAMLEEALAASLRGESLNYLKKGYA